MQLIICTTNMDQAKWQVNAADTIVYKQNFYVEKKTLWYLKFLFYEIGY